MKYNIDLYSTYTLLRTTSGCEHKQYRIALSMFRSSNDHTIPSFKDPEK